MNLKNVQKTVIEISSQELIDELISNFKEFTTDENNDISVVLVHSQFLAQSLDFINSKNYSCLFANNGALRCLPEKVFEKVENYFYGQEDEDEEPKKQPNVVSFKEASKKLQQTELEIVIKENDEIVGRISEEEIQY